VSDEPWSPTATPLDALAARYRGGGPIPPEPDGVVRAMPVILRLERPPAARTPVLEAAAAAALAVCLDPRAAPGGEWHEAVASWVAARIRKIARRARGAHWEVVQELPGITWSVGDAQVRALLPGPVDAVPKVVSRLQIGGTDLEPDEPGPVPTGSAVIWLNAALELTVGKAAAQVGHASMLFAAARGLAVMPPSVGWPRWAGSPVPPGTCTTVLRGLPVIPPFAVRSADAARWSELCAQVERGAAVAVRDAGFTEVAPGTITCITTGAGHGVVTREYS